MVCASGPTLKRWGRPCKRRGTWSVNRHKKSRLREDQSHKRPKKNLSTVIMAYLKGNVNMREIRLLRLTLDNFKGQRHRVLEFGGRSADIYGDNAAGKTTVYDGLTWLLFDKDSHGQSAFDVKPLGPDGQVRDHGAVTMVEAVLDAGERTVTLTKTYFEKWSTQRGSAVETFGGNTSEYFVDKVPCKKYEYERQVAELVDEETFRLLTGVTYFCQGMGWQDRRKVLFDVCGVGTDGEIMAEAPQFAPLAAALGRLSLDDYRKKLTAERRGLSRERETVPARLDECQKTIRDLEGVDYAELRLEREKRATKMADLTAELVKLEHNTLLDTKRNELGGLQNQLVRLEQENAAFRQSQAVPVTDERPALRREIARQEQLFSRWTADQRSAERDAEYDDQQVADCKARWYEVNAEGFTGASCPTCGQALPAEQLEASHARFEKDKARRLDGLVAEADRWKEKAAEARERREHAIRQCVEIENHVAALKDKLNAAPPVEQPEITDMTGYDAQRAELLEAVGALEGVIADIRGESTSIRKETQARIDALRDEIRVLDGELSKESMLSYARERMDALRAEAQAAAEKLESLDKMLFLCDEFTRYKVRFVEESINSKFRLVGFRLFQEQVNGGVAECCDPVVDGVPYSSLNNGARINAGMDVIATLSEHYGIRVPLFVDNAESVTELMDLDTQVIRLVVSKQDQELRCEYET